MSLAVREPVAVAPGSTDIRALVERHRTTEEEVRTLTSCVLLHLPRIASAQGTVAAADAEAEVARLAVRQTPTPAWMRVPPVAPRHATDLRLERLDAERARVIHEQCHYLRSHRPGGLDLAGVVDDRVAAALSFAPLDLRPIGATLPEGVATSEVWVLTRVYAVEWAPRNTLSRLLAMAARRVRESEPRARLLLTYLNPGLGFDGASYRAANWSLYGREHGTRYAYLDADYVTDRELRRRFGTSDAGALEHLLGPRVAFSRMHLPPLALFAFALDPRLRRVLADLPPREWPRPWD